MSQEDSQASRSALRATPAPEIDFELISDYIQQQGFWQSDERAAKDEYFGDIVETIIETAHPPDPRPAFPPGPHYLPLKIVLLGPSFSGKHALAKGLQEKYGVRPYEVKTIVAEAIRAMEKKLEPEDPKRRKQQEEAESELFMRVAEEVFQTRENVPPILKGEILRARLRSVFGDEPKPLEELEPPTKGKKKVDDQPKRNTHGAVIIAYPTNLQEAKDLEKALSGYVHPDDLPEPLSAVKLRDASILITPSEKPPPTVEKERSFFDIVFMLDGDLDNIILRSTNRRVDPQGNQWNLTFNPPPDNLLPKLKLIDDPEHTPDKLTAKYQEFETYKAELYEWLNQFGYHAWGESLLELIETDIGAKEVLQKAVTKIEKILKLKEEHADMLGTGERSRMPSTRLFYGQTIEVSLSTATALYNSFEKMKTKYLTAVSNALRALPEVKVKAGYLADAIKSDFKDFLARPDAKQDTLSPFLQALDSLISSKPYIPSAEKKEIFEQVEEMSDQLWEIIYARKDEDVMERQRIIESTPYVGLYAEAMEVAKELLQAESLWFYSALNLEKDFNSLVLKRMSGEKFNLPVLSLNLKKRVESEYGTVVGAKGILKALQTQLVESVPQDNGDLRCFAGELQLFSSRVSVVIEKVFSVLDDIGADEKETCDLLDDWIVDAVKWENNCVNDILAKAKEAVTAHSTLTAFQLPAGAEVHSALRSCIQQIT